MILALLACLHGTAGVPTPIHPPDLERVLSKAHVVLLGVRPSRARLRVALAQTLVEGARVSRCYNLGSVSATPRQAYYRPGGVGQRMRAFKSFAEGAAAYWSAVRRCKGAFAAFDTGDAAVAARALEACGYYTADRAAYARAMVAVMKGISK